MRPPKVLFRKPDFHKVYPTARDFAAALDLFKASSALPKQARAIDTPDLAALEGALSSGHLPPHVSSRAIGQALLKASDSRIVSEYEGRIGTLLITVPRDFDHDDHVHPLHARHFQALLRGMGPTVKYVIVHSPRQQSTIQTWLKDAGVSPGNAQLVSSPVFRYSIWAQDAYAALADRSGRSVLCEGVSFTRAEDMTIADDIAAQTDVGTLQSYLYFQGGNVLGGEQLTLMGLDYISRNTSRHRLLSSADVIAQFESLWGTEVLPLGGETAPYDSPWWAENILSGYGQQPIFHIDMYVTPTGVLGQSGKPIVFLGSPACARQIVGQWNEANISNGEVYDSFFGQTERQLATRFEVRKLPLWLVYGNLGQPYERDWPRKYYALTWNNAIVQNDGKSRNVLLPNFADAEDCNAYGVDVAIREKLQTAAEEQWRELGFNVARMDGLEDLAYAEGSVHCITKALSRVRAPS